MTYICHKFLLAHHYGRRRPVVIDQDCYKKPNLILQNSLPAIARIQQASPRFGSMLLRCTQEIFSQAVNHAISFMVQHPEIGLQKSRKHSRILWSYAGNKTKQQQQQKPPQLNICTFCKDFAQKIKFESLFW